MTQDETRKCLHCGEIKPLTAEHFQAIRFLLRNFHFFALPVTQNQKQERPALKALEVGFIHGAKVGLASAPLGEEAPLTYPTLQGPVPQGEHLPQRFLQ